MDSNNIKNKFNTTARILQGAGIIAFTIGIGMLVGADTIPDITETAKNLKTINL